MSDRYRVHPCHFVSVLGGIVTELKTAGCWAVELVRLASVVTYSGQNIEGKCPKRRLLLQNDANEAEATANRVQQS